MQLGVLFQETWEEDFTRHLAAAVGEYPHAEMPGVEVTVTDASTWTAGCEQDAKLFLVL